LGARSLRRQRELAIIFLTARDAVADRVAGLERGADDYLVKPCALEELLARVRAVLRRRGAIPRVLEAGRLLVDEEHGFAVRAGRELGLTATELRLLAFLMRHRGQVLSKDQLLTQVWGDDAYDHNLVEVHISALRRKLEAPGAGGGRLIHTVRGIGYRFSP
jgi:two-component system OmpR family response regulator